MNETFDTLRTRYGARDWRDIRGDLSSVSLDASATRDAIAWLKDEGGYRHLAMVTAVDNLERGIFTLTYNLRNHDAGRNLLVHCDISRDNAVMDSIHLLWEQAWTYQREMKEWYGIDFPGSPRVDEEFVLEGWEGPPIMRRDFDSLAYSDATYADRPGRTTEDPATYMKSKLYPEAAR
jgi:NADH-quinone oxidoreductase subunit C